MPDTTELVERSLSAATAETFTKRVEEQAADLRAAIAAGDFDNPDFAVGLELEVYGVSWPESASGSAADSAIESPYHGAVTALPDAVFSGVANKELGRHNAELNTEPTRFDADGLSAQAAEIADRFDRARDAAREADCELVTDAMWTIPPAIGSERYLGAVVDEDGLPRAEHMSPDPRYIAIDRDVLDAAGGSLELSVPGADLTFPTILFESLATSIQPHLQIPSADALPAHYNTAIRTLGPVLALSANSPFLPGDLYAVDDPEALLEETHHELRIAVFEQSVNYTDRPKVRVPSDIDAAADVIDRVVADDLYAPFLREWLDDSDREAFADRFWEFEHKRSTYWRWLRCVVGGDPVDGAGDERSLRIEYRPIPTQPTVRDVVGMQALTAGLVRGLVAADHPLWELPWAAAERSFYAAAESGLDADLAWMTADGERTTDADVVFAEVFEYARRGLSEAGVPSSAIDRYLEPIEARWRTGTTPSAWKIDRVREGLADGASLSAAIASMQREYVRRSRETASFAEWLS